ncbi:MAG: stage 0 sporulation family protein [Oscillospiraceae bacterium]|jgi:cell fate regulator YaaT (PSP1 superfamily)|nr:stage 0 sporulation family protein [Oscillospiraceae bacterium]
MIEVIGVKFKPAGKMYYFDPIDSAIEAGTKVIVETARGVECGEAIMPNTMVSEESIVGALKPILRLASESDMEIYYANREKEKEALEICAKKIEKHKLLMKLVDVEYTFDGNKILFYFTADGRIDFRELVKDLASVFRTRIELRQIGVRDEAKMLGGLGICGRPFCCSSFLGDFQPVSIKMAKEQGLSLNPTKISGSCGRLMCCLKYEQDVYEELLKITPKVGALVRYGKERAVVTEANIFTGKLSIRPEKEPDAAVKAVNRSEVRLIKDAKITLSDSELKELKNLEE